ANPKRSLSDDPYQAEIDIAADIERRKREGEDPIATDTLTSRMSWDEQMDWAIRNDIERAARGMGVKSQEAVLPDEFEGIWPVPDMEIQHKVWKLLRPHQLGAVKMARAAFENGASMFLLADGTGTGKTWAGLGTALEHQLHAGGKIILVTQGNVAVESWLADEFGPEKMDVPREAILSPTDIANLTPKELTQRLAAANMVIGLWHHFDPNKDSTNQYRALQEMAKSGDVSAVFADEIHTIRNWVKGTERAVRGVDWVDQLVDNNAKVIAASATPGNELYDLRYFAKGFLGKSAGNDEFRSWVLGAGYSGRQGGKAIARNPKREKVILASQLAFRQDLGRRGLMVNREMSYEGVAVIPGKVHLTPDDLARFEALEEKYAILSEAFSIAGTSGLKGILSPLIINESRRFAEEFKISAAIDWAIDALRRGRRPVIMTRYLNESAQNAVDEMVEDPKTGKMTVKYGMLNKPREKLDGMSVRDIINQKMPGYGDALNERLEEINTRLGKAVPSIASMIEEFRRRARAELGYDINVAEFHGALPDSLKVEHVQNWKNPETTLDAMVGSDLSMGTGISLHDLIGRGVTQIMVGLSWKAGEMVQTIGRGNRDGQLSWPEHVWLQATELWPEERQLKKIFAHMSSLRAQVRGLRSEKDDIKTVVDAGGLTLQGLRDESEVEIDEASRILEEAKKRVERRRREREGLDVEPIKDESDGITIEPETLEERREQEAPALDFLRDAMLRAKAVRKELGESGPDLTGYKDLGFNSFEAWKSEVERAAQDLTQEFDADAIEAKTVPMEDVYTLAMRGSAGRRLGDLMLSPDIKGNEEEAKAHLAAVLGSVGPGGTGAIEGGDKKDNGLGSRVRQGGGRGARKGIRPPPSPQEVTKAGRPDPPHKPLVAALQPVGS
nr:DEAD/DEAH box helicase family protein [Planctomycetota bacterium]